MNRRRAADGDRREDLKSALTEAGRSVRRRRRNERWPANRTMARLSVLIVEESENDLRLIRETLAGNSTQAFELTVAKSFTEAAEQLRRMTPDAILLDLPEVKGLAALDRILNLAQDTPVVALTAGGIDPTLEVLRLGAQDCLPKSAISCQSLPRILRSAVERERLQRAESFISGTAQLLSASLSLKDVTARLASLSSDTLADYTVIHLAGANGKLKRHLVAPRNPADCGIAESLRALELDRSSPHLGFEAATRRRTRFVRNTTAEELAEIIQSSEHARVLSGMGIRSYLELPLIADTKLIGVLVLITTTFEMSDDDLLLARRFADIAAAAVHNACLYERAAEALRTRDRVLGVVAHDLRNPLSTIAMIADLLMDVPMDEGQRQKQLQVLHRSTSHMNRLIEDLLDVARIEEGHLALDRSYQDPGRLAMEVIEGNRSLATAAGLHLVDEISECGPVEVDPDRIRQVLTNLVANAIKFTPQGGTVRVTTEATGGLARFAVTDTGPGIAPDDLERLFLPFWQGRGRSAGGAGLGLSIARGIVDAHGGRIWAESEMGRGTTMVFTLPLADDRRSWDPSGGADARISKRPVRRDAPPALEPIESGPEETRLIKPPKALSPRSGKVMAMPGWDVGVVGP